MQNETHSEKSNQYAVLDHKVRDSQTTFCGLKINSVDLENFKARVGSLHGRGRFLKISENWLTVTCPNCQKERYGATSGTTFVQPKKIAVVNGQVRSILFQDLESVQEPRNIKSLEKGQVFDL